MCLIFKCFNNAEDLKYIYFIVVIFIIFISILQDNITYTLLFIYYMYIIYYLHIDFLKLYMPAVSFVFRFHFKICLLSQPSGK